MAGGALVALAAGPGPAAAAEPIEGSWLFQDGEVLVQAERAGSVPRDRGQADPFRGLPASRG